MQSELVAISSLSLDPANVRKHPDKNIQSIIASLKRFGQQKPIVVDANGIVRAGNGTLMAAQQLGYTEIAIVRSPLKGSEATAYAIADNRTAELAEWDEGSLAEQLAALQIEDEELALATGFDEADIDALLAPDEVIEDEVPEPPEIAITKRGDVWLLGDHRAMCGDSTSVDDVARLMHGETASLTVLDPPFEMPTSVWVKWIADPSIVFGQAAHIRAIPDALWRFERIVVKRYSHRSATVQIGHQHAFVVQCGTVKTCPKSVETFPSVIDQEVEREHDHAKPVAMIAEHMKNWTPHWKLCVDPFLGSGSTLIAAEQLNRKCYGMEISPQYCDVIVARWEKLTGKKAQLETV